MISILSGVVLMVAIGTVIQHADGLPDFLGGDKPQIILTDDVVAAPSNSLLRIDVFQNDIGLAQRHRGALQIVSAPACGRVFVQNETLQYLPDADCSGEQLIRYGIKGMDGVEPATVLAQIRGQDIGAPLKANGQSPAEVEAGPAAPTSEQPTPNVLAVVAGDTTQPAENAGDAAQPRDVATAEIKAPSAAETLVRAIGRGGTDVAEAATPPAQGLGNTIVPRARPTIEDPDLSEQDPVIPIGDLAVLGAPIATDRTFQHGGRTDRPVAGGEAFQPTLAAVENASTAVPLRPTAGALAISSIAPAVLGETSFTDVPALGAQPAWDAAPSRQIAVVRPQEIALAEFMVAVVDRHEPRTVAPDALHALGLDAGIGTSLLIGVSREGAQPSHGTPAHIGQGRAAPLSLPRIPEHLAEEELTVETPVLAAVDPLQVPAGEDAFEQSGASDDEGVPVIARDAAPTSIAPAVPAAETGEALAALPSAVANCTAPPATTLDIGRAANTTVTLEAPCYSGTIAELSYSGLRLAVPLDGEGKGRIKTLGFEPNADAVLTFVDGETLTFDLPFRGSNRVSRVALIWDDPIALELNAFEFGAPHGSARHLSPENPSGFSDVRRSGGGFLNGYRALGGVGQNVQIYSHWHRRGGQTGLVELKIGFASRDRERVSETCDNGVYAAPQFLILRAARGRPERGVLRRLAAMACSEVGLEYTSKSLISGAVSDLIVTGK